MRAACRHFSLFPVSVATWGGFVFINLSGKEKPKFTDQFSNYKLQDLRIGKRIVTDVNAKWKLIAENFSECFHCPPVHPELCWVVTAYREAGAWGLSRDFDSRPEYMRGAVTLTVDGSARIPAFRNL